MANKITINPVTRISGFLEIEVEVEQNKIINSKSSGLLFRGFEKMLRGRSPLDAIYFTERICGICSTAHSMASTLALEDALHIQPNENDKMIRDFMHGSEHLQNHLRHFYQYTIPDFVKGARMEPSFISSHNDYRLPEKIDKELSKHYLDSLKFSKLAHEMIAVLGGKAPHNHGIFVGGVTVNIESAKWIKIKSILSDIKKFVIELLIPDVYTIANYYPDYFNIGIGYKNLMSYGLFDSYTDKRAFYVAPGVIINGVYGALNADKITENIQRAWYESVSDVESSTDTTVNENIHKENAYSWIKAPRYDGYAMEVGPLARMWLSGNYNRGISTMDRTIARVLEVKKIIETMEVFLDKIMLLPTNQGIYEFTQDSFGKGLTDTTRGALGHWISVKNQTIQNYDIITPSSWNLSPEDSKGLKGVVEEALIGTVIQDIKNPVEIGRVVRSFDPCVSCATHVLTNKYSPVEIRVV